MKKKNLGFTLAEVLIVIGIIGVVAALTLPNLNHATGDKETVTKVKKIYSALTEAFDRAQVIYGSYDTWFNDLEGFGGITDWATASERFAKRVTEFMKVSKDCGFDGGCLDDSEDYLDNGYSLILADGMAIEFSVGGSTFGNIAVDINGPNKGKNTYGYDIFEFGPIDFDSHIAIAPDSRSALDGFIENDDEGTPHYEEMYYNTAWIIKNENLDYLKTDENYKCNNSDIVLNWAANSSCH